MDVGLSYQISQILSRGTDGILRPEVKTRFDYICGEGKLEKSKRATTMKAG